MQLKALRPIDSKGPYGWAHLDDGDGKPLCGVIPAPNARYTLRPETVYEGERLCRSCQHVSSGYEIEVVQHGQLRAYGDSEFIYNVTDLETPPRDEATVLAYCQEHIKLSYTRLERPSWASPTLMRFSQVESGKWRYHVREAYTG
jgi:hypothetical protein